MLINDPKIIGNRLRNIRKECKMSQEEIAYSAGLSTRAYADIERGNTNMRFGTLIRICEVLDITPDMLVTSGFPLNSSCYEQTRKDEISLNIRSLPKKEQEVAAELVRVYVESLHLNNK